MPYTTRPELYDVAYAFKDYAGEADAIRRIVEARRPGALTLLDVACGTGKHLEHLRAGFACEGLDVDAALLEVARARLPDLALHEGDMRDFELGRQFDV